MRRHRCLYCHRRVIHGRKRKYCDLHSKQASKLWKRKHRRLWAASGDKYWLADWKNRTSEERRRYFRIYMQAYRRQKNMRTGFRSPANLPSAAPNMPSDKIIGQMGLVGKIRRNRIASDLAVDTRLRDARIK